MENEDKALTYGLDQHIPPITRKNTIETEFEYFYQNILNDISDVPSDKLDSIKTKLRSSCENFYNKQTPYKYKTIIKQLSINEEVIIMKQDKGRGVVIMNRSKYLEKCLSILQGKQFMKLDRDPTSKLESKVQRILRKIKSKLSENIYKKLYPTGSAQDKFYRNAEIHKLSSNDLDGLPLRPIVSNIGIATYETAKYNAKLLSPLSKSNYTINSTKQFVNYIRKQKVPGGYQMMSFDVTSIFTNAPLEETIEITLQKVYIDQEINTNIPKKEMKELLYQCTKNIHFIFNGEIDIQIDGVTVGSPLGLVLANIFMVELEKILYQS